CSRLSTLRKASFIDNRPDQIADFNRCPLLQRNRLECYQRFEARAKTGNETDADPNACDSLPSD
ncbi:DUF3330 domain-containing protein, partial [Comamonas sp. w2-DMI]|uniref:DUF3330 domain-containing protein n=1 Tax=Comamonas sp. w2-DMI TaxID=3126391 RepID=UPI0032E51F01